MEDYFHNKVDALYQSFNLASTFFDKKYNVY